MRARGGITRLLQAGRRRPGALRSRMPMAAVAIVILVALGSTAVWVTHAKAPAEYAEPDTWPGLGMVPTR